MQVVILSWYRLNKLNSTDKRGWCLHEINEILQTLETTLTQIQPLRVKV